MDIKQAALDFHLKLKGKIEITVKAKVDTREELSLAYTPGVAEPCKEIAADPTKVWDYTGKGNLVAVVTDGTAVLGLGDIGPEAAIPVMEGKALLFKEFAGIDAMPICLRTKNVDEIVMIVKALEPTFGGINLEDISAPRCFEVEERLKADMNIPVFHDDQHGTAVVVLAGLINAVKVSGKDLTTLKVVMSGSGAAGTAIAKILYSQGVKDVVMLDRHGVISSKREDLNEAKKNLLSFTNPTDITGDFNEALVGRDVFIGVSGPGVLTADHVKSMADKPIIFALANPTPEIMPDEAKQAGAYVVATGRSDFPNQINNVLAFPGIFRGALDARARAITEPMKLAAAHALADYVVDPTPDKIIPDPLDKKVTEKVAEAVRLAV
ncbi:MAG: NAD-dependent malic enzyme [Candidatus Vogelbacteria bacterium]|nr:NAD-dependent malic enzyme [Candidatus Vogelbacteria bacterium]